VKPNTEQAPDNARFLSEHDIKVEKQKVARGARNEPMVAKSKPAELTAKQDPPKEDPSMGKPPDKRQNPKAPENPTTLTTARVRRHPRRRRRRDRAWREGDTKQPIVSDGSSTGGATRGR
jgi:hypothetical protein